MPLTTYTLTGNLKNLFGTDFDSTRTRAWLETNAGDGGIIFDRDGNTVRIGGSAITINADGTFTQPGLIGFDNAGSDVNPTGIQYRVWIAFTTARTSETVLYNTGFFSMSANVDLTDVVSDQFVPPEYQGALISRLEGIRDEGIVIREQTRDLRDEAEALIISDLGTSDGQVSTLINSNSSLTFAALQARIDDADNLTLMGVY